jgi:hypothetical protein
MTRIGIATAGLTLLLWLGIAGAAAAGQQPPGFFDPDSRFFATASTESSDTLDTDSDGDLWPSCWADDGHLYAANGDGRGFSDEPWQDIVVNRVEGTPESGISGERLSAADDVAPIWADPARYNRKPTGMACVDSDGDGRDELYLAVQDLSKPPCPCFDDAPNASISVSRDYGRTWEQSEAPMFTDHRFTTIVFLDYGQSFEHDRVLGRDASRYVYAYGLDFNWRDSFANTVEDPTKLYLARVRKDRIMDRSAWEFMAGERGGRPTWTRSLEQREPVLEDDRRVYPSFRGEGISDMTVLSQGSIVYDEPLDRYIYASWTEYTWEFYEAPRPWGPWKLFMRKDFGGYPWFGRGTDPGCPGPKNGGYATVMPSKFISGDGRTLWVQSNWFVGVGCNPWNYNFSLRKVHVEPAVHSRPANRADPGRNLAVSGAGVTPIEKSAHFGNEEFLNDGVRSHSEDSWDRENKPLDFWGYTFTREHRFDRVVYTTGTMFPDGGWFSGQDGGLRVQVRRNFRWHDVGKLEITPDYPYDASAGSNRTYTLDFEDARGDGVRIIGHPGGTEWFTSVAELEVFYARQGHR